MKDNIKAWNLFYVKIGYYWWLQESDHFRSMMRIAMKRGGIATLMKFLDEANDSEKETAVREAARVGNVEIINRYLPIITVDRKPILNVAIAAGHIYVAKRIIVNMSDYDEDEDKPIEIQPKCCKRRDWK